MDWVLVLQKYEDITFLKQHLLSLTSLGLILTTKIQSPWYQASGNPDPHAVPDLFSDRDPARHAAARRKVASAYSMTSLAQLEPFVDECSSILKAKFTKFANSGEPVNMAHWLQCLHLMSLER